MPLFLFFNDTSTTEIYTLSLHDALPILNNRNKKKRSHFPLSQESASKSKIEWAPSYGKNIISMTSGECEKHTAAHSGRDRKSTRLNSSHANISYAVFCLKKKNNRFLLY